MPSPEYILDQAIIFMHEEGIAITGNNPRRILTSMLQDQQPIVKQLVNWVFTDYTDNSTHELYALKTKIWSN
ncbi:hypothetical protein LG202_11470 [Methylobacillus methanolivorans]